MTLETMALGAIMGYLAGSAPSPEVINDLREKKPYPYKTLTVDASTARLLEEKNIAGYFLYVEDSDTSVDIYVKLNEPENEWLNLSKLQFIWLQFYRFFIKNEAGTGSMDIIIGKGYGFTVSPKQIDVNLAAQTVGNITVDVAAMAVGTIDVDVTAMTVGTIDVDLVAQTVGNISVDLAAQTIGNIDVNLAAQAADIDINIAAADIMLPVDIQGQYLTLDIDIVAQTVGNINVDLAAQTVGNIDVDIAAQTVGDINISIDAQSVGIYLQPTWAALQATDKNFSTNGANKAWNNGVAVQYVVPGDTIFFCCGFSCEQHASAAEDYDHFLYFQAGIGNYDGGDPRVISGGIGGTVVELNKPFAYTDILGFQTWMYNYSNVNCDLWIVAWGFEVEF